jgi:hypothetical protein
MEVKAPSSGFLSFSLNYQNAIGGADAKSPTKSATASIPA